MQLLSATCSLAVGINWASVNRIGTFLAEISVLVLFEDLNFILVHRLQELRWPQN